MVKIWAVSFSSPLPFFLKTPNEIGKGFSFDVFQEQGCSFSNKQIMTDEWLRWGNVILFS